MKNSIFNGYSYFAVGILVLTVLTSFTRLTCPIDGGTGVISGAEALKVTDVEYVLVDSKIYDTGCAETYSDYTYSVNVSLTNDTAASEVGALVVKFYHPLAVKGAVDLATALQILADQQEAQVQSVTVTEEVSKGGLITTFIAPPVATKLIYVDIPANTSQTVEETIQFRGFGYAEILGLISNGTTHVVSVAPPVDAITCPYSHGTGKVPLTEWLRLKAGI